MITKRYRTKGEKEKHMQTPKPLSVSKISSKDIWQINTSDIEKKKTRSSWLSTEDNQTREQYCEKVFGVSIQIFKVKIETR